MLDPMRSWVGLGQRGMVTAEFAVVLPAVVFVLALSLGAMGLALDQIRCVDARPCGCARRLAGGQPWGGHHCRQPCGSCRGQRVCELIR